MTLKLYPYQQELMDVISREGALYIQRFGRAYRPRLWHLMQSDPCDDWSEALGLNSNGLYPEAVIMGYDIDSVFIDEYSLMINELEKPVNLKRKDIMGEFEPMPYDYQQHDRTKRYGKTRRT